MNFSETIAVFDVKVGMYCKLNEFMTIGMSLRPCHSLSFIQGHSDFVVVNIFKHLLLRNQNKTCRSALGWGTKICSNGPGHMTKMAAIPTYGKNLYFFSSLDSIGRFS